MTAVGALTCALVLAAAAPARADDPLAGLVLEDDGGTERTLDELSGTPVLVVIGDRRASAQANAWGARLAAATRDLVAWRAAGQVAWLTVVDGRGVPEYARDSARTRIREGHADAERRRRTTFLIDWEGALAGRLGVDRGRVLVVLLSRDHVPFARAGGEPTDESVAKVVDAISGAAGR